jgi:hypothetical protein
MTDDFAEWLFKEHLNKPGRWRESAEKLKRGANLLFAAYESFSQLSGEEQAEAEDTRVAGVATLLYGLAMENIVKAVLLKEGIAKARPDGSVDWKVDGATQHDLVAMCRSSQIILLDARQEKLLERMSAFVHWAGKYPTPLGFRDKAKKDFKGLLLSDQPGAGKRMTPVEFGREDRDAFEHIYQTLAQMASGVVRRKKR